VARRLWRIRGARRLWRAARAARSLLIRRSIVLLYHRIMEVSADPWAICVSPRHFAEHLEILRQRGRVIPLRELVRRLADGTVPDRAVVVTFDDGYADNLERAKPILERYDVPATMFLATGGIGREREFWWDELDKVLLQPGTLPGTLTVDCCVRTHRWELGDAARYEDDIARRHRSWRAWDKETPTPRHALYRSLYEFMQPLPVSERRIVMDELLTWAGSSPTGRPNYRTLSHDEVTALARSELVEIGAHTVTHPLLSALPAAAQWEEISQSKARLEEILGAPVTSFAYPHGDRSDYTDETVALVREAQFRCACSAFGGAVERSTDQFQIPRFQVEDWDGEEFAKWLWQWFRN
jgi:peptidoglycan/xylan/chitin deacetylase (PgdA/CDA1 family)